MMASWLQNLALLFSAITFISWQFRAYKNLPALGATGLTYTPGWAIGYWFIPFANLVRPPQVVGEAWRGSDINVAAGSDAWKQAPGSALIGFWWGAWLIGNIASRISVSALESAGRSQSLDSMISSTATCLVIELLRLVPAVLAILVVRSLTARQEAKYRHLRGDAGADIVATAI